MPKTLENLTEEIADVAISGALAALRTISGKETSLVGKNCHIIILTTETTVSGKKPLTLSEKSLGNVEDKITNHCENARKRALELWNNDCLQELNGTSCHMEQGESTRWGGIKKGGIVVMCSGLRSPLSKMLSGIIMNLITFRLE